MVKIWASSNRVTPHDWLQLVLVVLKNGLQLQWKYYWKEEAKTLKLQGRVKGFEASQDQIFYEGHYSDAQNQVI